MKDREPSRRARLARRRTVRFWCFLAIVAAPVTARAQGPSRSWEDEVRKGIRRLEYDFSPAGDDKPMVLTAPNRAQGLRSRLGPEGITVRARSSEADGAEESWELTLRLSRFGRGDELRDVERVSPVAHENRIEYTRGGIREWYLNDERGIEQGFDLFARPAGRAGEQVVLEMDLGGGLLPRLSEDRQAVVFSNGGAVAVLRYGELRVADANGAAVAAELALDVGRLAIIIDDGSAAYPLHVDPLMTSPAWTAESDQVGAQFGYSVATAGDVNGDGYSDVIAGAPTYDNGEGNEGRAFLYLGSAGGLASTPAWTAESNQGSTFFGYSLASAEDVNGDGYSDVIVGARLYTNGQGNEGRAFLYYGNGGGGLDRIPRQARADGSAPIDLLGRSDSRTSFRLQALGRSPEGRGRVTLEWEVKPLGTPFDSSGTGMSPSSLDTGSPGAAGSAVALDELVSSLTPGTPHHWRLRLVTENPFFPRSPWLSLAGNNHSETDLRTARNQAPAALCQDITKSAGASCEATVSAAEVDDGSSDPEGDVFILSLSPPGPFALGATAVTLTATDVYGAQESCSATVTIADTTPPVIACPAPATLAANVGCAYAGAIPQATATDNCSAAGAIAVTSDAPASFPLGETVVTWTATDEAGRNATCASLITVTDSTPPEIACPAPATLAANVGCTYTGAIPQATATDNCSAAGAIAVTSDAPAAFPLGTTVVMWTATDAGGNDSSCSTTVTVGDATGPQVNCPDGITVECANLDGALVEFVATASDDCDGSVDVACSHESGGLFPVGTTAVTCTARDAAGNAGTCTFDVTVACKGGRQVPGDCNQDGGLDLSDLLCNAQQLFVGRRGSCGDGDASHPANMRLLDSNGDGKNDISDVIQLAGYLFGTCRVLPCPPHVLGESCVQIADCLDSPGCV